MLKMHLRNLMEVDLGHIWIFSKKARKKAAPWMVFVDGVTLVTVMVTQEIAWTAGSSALEFWLLLVCIYAPKVFTQRCVHA